jgi:hypothetical protein
MVRTLQRNSLALIVKLHRKVRTDGLKLIVNVATIVRSRKARRAAAARFMKARMAFTNIRTSASR